MPPADQRVHRVPLDEPHLEGHAELRREAPLEGLPELRLEPDLVEEDRLGHLDQDRRLVEGVLALHDDLVARHLAAVGVTEDGLDL